MKSDSSPQLLTVTEFAHRMGISVWTARQWAYHGKIASVKLSKRLQVPATECQRLIDAGLRPAKEIG